MKIRVEDFSEVDPTRGKKIIQIWEAADIEAKIFVTLHYGGIYSTHEYGPYQIVLIANEIFYYFKKLMAGEDNSELSILEEPIFLTKKAGGDFLSASYNARESHNNILDRMSYSELKQNHHTIDLFLRKHGYVTFHNE